MGKLGYLTKTVLISVFIIFLSSSTAAYAETYNILVHEMPRQWMDDFGNILDNALEFWKEVDPELEFNRVTYWKDADFSVEWASTFGGDVLGYYTTCCDDFGLPLVVITLGYFDESNNWVLTDAKYAKELMKHEIGHALSYNHTDDPNDIMFPFAFHEYEKWKELGSTTKKFIPFTEQRTEIPAWVRNNANWWQHAGEPDALGGETQ